MKEKLTGGAEYSGLKALGRPCVTESMNSIENGSVIISPVAFPASSTTNNCR